MLLHEDSVIIAVSLSGGCPPAELTLGIIITTNLTEYNKCVCVCVCVILIICTSAGQYNNIYYIYRYDPAAQLTILLYYNLYTIYRCIRYCRDGFTYTTWAHGLMYHDENIYNMISLRKTTTLLL